MFIFILSVRSYPVKPFNHPFIYIVTLWNLDIPVLFKGSVFRLFPIPF
jgi:hypothetical protein